jgi:hypothetical protein
MDDPALSFGGVFAVNSRSADAHVERFCQLSHESRDTLKTLPRSPAGRDAAAFMAPLMDYEKPLNGIRGQLRLPQPLVDRVYAYGNDWFTRITDADLEGLDFGWMEKLEQFDHWSLLGAGPLRDGPYEHFNSAPFPNYISLGQWAKLRYAMARRRGDLPRASAEVRQLADLTRSQDELIAEMIAQSLYRLDGAARAAANASGFNISGWERVDPDALVKLRKVEFASPFFAWPGVKLETLRRAVACMPRPCMALVEAASMNRRASLAGPDNFKVVRELAEKYNCEAAVLERVAGEVPDDPEVLGAKDPEFPEPDDPIAKYLDTER